MPLKSRELHNTWRKLRKRPLVAILVRFLPVVLATSNPQSLYTSKSSQQFLLYLIHSITGKMQFDIHLVIFTLGHLAPEIEPLPN